MRNEKTFWKMKTLGIRKRTANLNYCLPTNCFFKSVTVCFLQQEKMFVLSTAQKDKTKIEDHISMRKSPPKKLSHRFRFQRFSWIFTSFPNFFVNFPKTVHSTRGIVIRDSVKMEVRLIAMLRRGLQVTITCQSSDFIIWFECQRKLVEATEENVREN